MRRYHNFPLIRLLLDIDTHKNQNDSPIFNENKEVPSCARINATKQSTGTLHDCSKQEK